MEYANSFSDNQTLISAKEVLRRVGDAANLLI